MKGAILSSGLLVLIFSVFLSLSYFVSYEHNRSHISNNFKKSLTQSAEIIKNSEQVEIEGVLQIISDEIIESLPTNFTYNLSLLGFNEDPILLRVRMEVYNKNLNYSFTFEEVIIEKELADEV